MLCKCSGKYIDIYFILKITFFSYVLPYIFLFSFIVFFVICTMCCRVPVLIGLLAQQRHVASFWPVLLALVSTLSFYGLVPRRLVSFLFKNNRHIVAWPCLPHSWDPPAFWLQHCLSQHDCRLYALVRFRLFCAIASHLTLTVT